MNKPAANGRGTTWRCSAESGEPSGGTTAWRVRILVEGYASVLWLHQNGFENVVSCMGPSVSEQQVELLAKRFKGVEIFFDGDEACREAANRVALELARKVWVRIVDCPEGLQPDRLPAHELKRVLSSGGEP